MVLLECHFSAADKKEEPRCVLDRLYEAQCIPLLVLRELMKRKVDEKAGSCGQRSCEGSVITKGQVAVRSAGSDGNVKLEISEVVGGTKLLRYADRTDECMEEYRSDMVVLFHKLLTSC